MTRCMAVAEGQVHPLQHLSLNVGRERCQEGHRNLGFGGWKDGVLGRQDSVREMRHEELLTSVIPANPWLTPHVHVGTKTYVAFSGSHG